MYYYGGYSQGNTGGCGCHSSTYSGGYNYPMYGGYGYGGYGGYGSNYYNYMMMAQFASASSGSTESVSTELDKDRFYSANLNGPCNAEAVRGTQDIETLPRISITFAAPKTAE